MHITLVKKILADGSPCPKCNDVINRLEKDGQMPMIDQIVVADERDPNSEGLRLADQYNVDRAPFFIVENTKDDVRIYTVYMKFVKEVIQQRVSDIDEAKEILQNSSDLDFL